MSGEKWSTEQRLVLEYWNATFHNGLLNDGIPPREVRFMRKRYIADVLADPKAIEQIRVWSAERNTMRKWEYVRKFTLTKGALNAVADSYLTKNQVRRTAVGEEPAYIQYGIIEADLYWQAMEQSRRMLDDLLSPYGVEILCFEVHVTLVREGAK